MRRLVIPLVALALAACSLAPTPAATRAPASATPAPSATLPSGSGLTSPTPRPGAATATASPRAPGPAATPTLTSAPATPTRRAVAAGTRLPETQPLTPDNVAALSRLARWPIGLAGVRALTFSASSRSLWLSDGDLAQAWRVRDGVLIRTLRGEALSPDGLLSANTFGLAAQDPGAPDSLVYVLTDLAGGVERKRWQDVKPILAEVRNCGPGDCAALRFAPDAGTLAELEDFSAGRPNSAPTLKVWRLDGVLIWTAPGVQAFTYAPDGMLMITRRATAPPIDIWRVRDGARLTSLAPGLVAGLMTVSPDGARVALSDGRQVQVWRWAEGARQAAWEVEGVMSLAFSADGALVAGGFPGRVDFWRAADGARLFTLDLPGGDGQVALSPDGRALAVVAGENLEIWGVR